MIQEYTMPDNEDETMNNSDPVVIVLSALKTIDKTSRKIEKFLIKGECH
ncbi:hypothetical protein [Bacillus velezensis]